MIKKIKIGNLTLKNNLFLAPLAGITDSPFRTICLKGGAGLVWAEMVSSQALKHENKRSNKMLFIGEDEHPVAMQIFGSELESIAISTKKADEFGADIIDINAGCPVKKILKSNSGAALMYDEILLGKIIATAVKSTKKPITLKTRIGIKQGQISGDKLAKIAESEGASAVCIHARYVSQVHSGEPDLEALNKVCNAVKIPVIANGGVENFETAKKMFETGAQAVMIGRGAIGNPSIFKNIIDEANGKIPKPLTLENQLKLFLQLVESNTKYYGEKMGILRSRKVVGYWIRGFDNSATIRQEFMKATTLAEVRQVISEMIS
ncbi:MAG: tRNA dihydrouridine synthase DusB [Elusimicrobiaceae bacterium]|nr:tRNA dihydrouridine synthase DusB [Elusimicrobiaceae bacterium]MBT5987228.1 tRNA dihydrouridine synthase DusB [Elusimicrobiaceae bacterium]